MLKQIANWFRRKKLESGLDRELSYHVERRTADLEKTGLSSADARRRALSEVGGVAQVQEEVRDVWLSRWLRDFTYDFRFSARAFFRAPSFSLTAVLSLVLGIGATTAIYSLVDQVLLHALPVREPRRLVLIDWPDDPVFDGFGKVIAAVGLSGTTGQIDKASVRKTAEMAKEAAREISRRLTASPAARYRAH